MRDSRSHQASLLVRGLATLPGGMAFNVVARRFPRLGPAEAQTGYEQVERCFACNDIPYPLPLPVGMDDIFITLQGVLETPGIADDVRAQLGYLLGMPEVGDGWECRQRFMGRDNSYQVTVFTEAFVNTRGS